MELQQHSIHRKYKKAEAKSQITIGDDVSIPEGKPDIELVLQKKADFHVDEVHTEKGKIRVRGSLFLSVLYLTKQALPAHTVSNLEAEFPFDEILYMEGAATGDNLKLDWNVEELRVTVIHPGKLGVRAIVTLFGSIAAMPEIMLTEAAEERPGVYMKKESLRLAESVVERKDSYRIRDEILLPVNKPNVKEILWKDLQVRGLDLRVQEGRLAVKGELLFFVVYESEEEQGSVQWMEQSVPFHGSIEAEGITPEMFGMIETETAHQEIELKPDYDGELRMFQVELFLDVHMHIYEEKMYHVLKDAYSTRECLQLEREEAVYEKLRICNQMKVRVGGQEKPEEDVRILQILGHHAVLKNCIKRQTENGILCEGALEVQVLYISANDERPFGSVTVMIPYSQLLELVETAPSDRWAVSEAIEHVFITMPESGRIEVRGVIVLNACVMEQCRFENIAAVTEKPYDVLEYRKQPGMRIHFVQPGENLWNLAKENRLTVENIKKLNELTVEEITPGQKLVIAKAMEE